MYGISASNTECVQPERSRSASGAYCEDRWPEDYCALDEGRLLVRRDCVPVFEELGWTTVQATMQADPSQRLRRLADRENAIVELPSARGNGPIRAYLKRHWTRNLSGWLAARLTGRQYTAPGRAEADSVGQCQAAGVNCVSVIAAGQRPGSLPWHSTSFFLSEALEGFEPADDFWRRRFQQCADCSERRSFLSALAATARRFHRAGLCHKDFYWCHFFVREPSHAQFEVRLIDLQRVHPMRLSWPRWQLKDLAAFWFSAPSGVARAELSFWFRQYLGKDRPGTINRLAELAVRFRAACYRWKDARG